jgi:hypothetical protein
MSKAYRCDRCGEFFDGSPELRVKTNKLIIALNYCPESNESNWYAHDFCEQDARDFVEWFKAKRKE